MTAAEKIAPRIRLTGADLQRACAEGRFEPIGPRVLLEAIHEEDAIDSPLMAHNEVRGMRDARDAIAFRVLALGSGVPADCGFAVDEIVTHNSATGDVVDHTEKSCAYWCCHWQDVFGRVRG